MPAASSSSAWQRCLASSAIGSVLGLALLAGSIGAWAATAVVDNPSSSTVPAQSEAIRPYRVHVDEAKLADLRKRIVDARWPG